MLEPIFNQSFSASKTKMIGVGDAGGKIVVHLARCFQRSEFSFYNVEFLSISADRTSLEYQQKCFVNLKIIQIGKEMFKGFWGPPDFSLPLGKLAVEEQRKLITEQLSETDRVIMIVGMGGMIGSSAAPTIAEILKYQGSHTTCIATIPVSPAEGRTRMKRANKYIKELSQIVDSLILLPNNSILRLFPKNDHLTLSQLFNKANDVLSKIVLGCSDSTTSDEVYKLELLSQQAVLVGRAFMDNN